jgi:lipopolysaccharide/colanic/teichoic acid biosynthesis glycosyltransferase
LGAGQYLFSHESVPVGQLPLTVKRIMDFLGGLVGLVCCAFAYLIYAPAIRRESSGSAIFRQTRIGRNGRPFTLYKLRTMHVTAEKQLQELRKHNEMNGNMFKIRDDPRITPVGRHLRKHHLDELPQFWNVLKGEMSLVGTRPPTPSEVAEYKPHHKRRLSMRPGVSGLWQLRGNAEIKDFETVVELDCKYIDSWSIWLDCKIIAFTILKVFRGGGY